MSAKDFYVELNMFNYDIQKQGSAGVRVRVGRGSSSLGASIVFFMCVVRDFRASTLLGYLFHKTIKTERFMLQHYSSNFIT